MSDDKKEREFLHTIMSPLAGVTMMLESMVDDLDGQPDPHGHLERIQAALGGTEKLRVSIEKRRQEIINGK